MKSQLALRPAIAMQARLQLFGSVDSLPGAQDAGAIYDPVAGRINIVTGSLKEFAAHAAKPFTVEEVEHIAEAYQAAARSASMGDLAPQQALNAMRVTTVDNYIRAMGNWGMYFEEEPLADKERPVFKHTHPTEVSVNYLAETGRPDTYQAVAAQKEVYPDLNVVSSDEVEYRIRDVYQGDIAEAAQRTFDIAFDLNAKIEALSKTLIDTAFGAFTVSGTKIDRTYIANSHIDTSNLPSTNELEAAGGTASSKMRLAVLKEVEKYCQQWAGVFSDGPLAPTGVVVVPSIAAADLLDEIDPSSAVNNKVAASVLDDYLAFTYAGRNWIIVPDVTLPAKQVYPILNKPLGKRFTKTSQDFEFVSPPSLEERIKLNIERRSQQKVLGLAYAAPKAVNVCRVRYQDA